MPKDPDLDGKISSNDLNCAVSSPNALIGSRSSSYGISSSYSKSHVPYFSVADSTFMTGAGLQPYFTLLSFNVKPLDAPPPWTTINVTGHSYTRRKSDPFVWSVDFPTGFHLPLLVKMQEYSGKAWDQLYRVEIVADFGEQHLDWEFCLDDLEVQFFKSNDTKGISDYSSKDQVLLHAG